MALLLRKIELKNFSERHGKTERNITASLRHGKDKSHTKSIIVISYLFINPPGSITYMKSTMHKTYRHVKKI